MAESKSMMNAVSAPMIAPDGSVRMIPNESMQEALGAGGQLAVPMVSPKGETHWIPTSQVYEAQKAGGKVDWSKVPQEHHEGFWSALGNGLGNIVKGVGDSITTGAQILAPGSALPGTGMISNQGMQKVVTTAAQAIQQDRQRKAEGRGLPYRGTALAATGVAGVDVPTMERHAAEGDSGAVMGDAVAPIVAVGATMGASKIAPRVLNAAGAGAKRTLLLGKTPAEAYQSALKPPPSTPAAVVERAVQTGLNEGIPVSPAGVEKLGALIDDVNARIADTVASDPTRKISSEAVATRADQIKPTFKQQVNASQDLASIENAKQQFRREQGARPAQPPKPTGMYDAYGKPIMDSGVPETPAQPMNPVDAQAMKVGTYRQLKKSYGTLKNAEVESQKALARGIKEELAQAFPELKDLNARDSSFLQLDPILERAVNRIGNHQVAGIGTPITAAGVQAITGNGFLAGVSAVMKAVLDNPNVKSRLAIALNRKGVPLSQVNTRLAAYSAALAASASRAANGEAPDDQTSQSQQ